MRRNASVATLIVLAFALVSRTGWAQDLEGQKPSRGASPEAALSPQPISRILDLADLFLQLGQYQQSASLLQEALNAGAGPKVALRLAEVQRQAGDNQAAKDTLATLAAKEAKGSTARVEALKRFGYLSAADGQHRAAAQAFRAALEEGGWQDVDLLRAAIVSYGQIGTTDPAIGMLRSALAQPGASAGVVAESRRQLADLLLRTGQRTAAIDALQQEVDRPNAPLAAYETLGRLLQEEGRCEEAVPILLEAIRRGGNVGARMQATFCYQDLGESERAIEQAEAALADPEATTSETRFTLYATLGYLQAGEGRDTEAAEAWREALMLRSDASIALARARSLRIDNQLSAAKVALELIDMATLQAEQQADYYDEWSVLYLQSGENASAVAALESAVNIVETPERLRRLGGLYRERGDTAGAERQYQRAIELNPEDAESRLTLAYLYRAEGRDLEALPHLEKALKQDPEQLAVRKELAYALEASGQREAASEQFREVIDQLSDEPALQGDAQVERSREVYGFKREVTELERNVVGSAYFVLGDALKIGEGMTSPIGETGSQNQGGAELGYNLPGTEWFRAGALQPFGRAFWGLDNNSLRPEGDSLQLGFGLRYRPFASQNVVLSAERLVAVGSDARDDWLFRASYSFLDGMDIDPRPSPTNFTSMYVDSAVIPSDNSAVFLNSEILQGISFKIPPYVVLSPHVVAFGQFIDDAETESALGLGPGLRATLWLGESRYEAARAYALVDVQYRWQAAGGLDSDGLFVRFVVGF